VLKPPGMTSHDVVDFVRGLAGQKRVGHAGILDAGAAGVLPLCLGRATRISEYFLSSDKAYRCLLVLGVATDSYDQAGRITRMTDASHLTREMLEEALERFRGTILQVPPLLSAGRFQGERLYRLARRGEEVPLSPREVKIHRLELLDWKPGRRPRALLEVECGKGAYMRTLCHDIGNALGVGGYLHFLVRTRHGPFRLEEAVTLEELEREGVEAHLVGAAAALSFLPRIGVWGEEARRLRHGLPPPPRRISGRPPEPGSLVCLVDPRGELLAISRVYPDRLNPQLVRFRLEKVVAGS